MMDALYNRKEVEEGDAHILEAFSDSDWAGNKEDRKSTTSVIVCFDSVPILSYSRGQKSHALSSCEAEVLAATSAASEGLFLKMLAEFLFEGNVKLEVRSDSSSGRSWFERSGSGRLKHMELRLYWMQGAVKARKLAVLPVPTKLNISDLNTKKLSVSRRDFLLYHIGAHDRDMDDGDAYVPVGAKEASEHVLEQSLQQHVRRMQSISKQGSSKAAKILHTSMLVQMILQSKAAVVPAAAATEAAVVLHVENTCPVVADAVGPSSHVLVILVLLVVACAVMLGILCCGMFRFAKTQRELRDLREELRLKIAECAVLEKAIEELEVANFDEIQCAVHVKEELRDERVQLRRLTAAVNEHRTKCPLGGAIAKTRFGTHWHVSTGCRHIEGRNLEYLDACSSCSHARPLEVPERYP